MNYRELMEKSDLACLKAMDYWFKGDKVMATFWKKVSQGYKIKALEMKIDV